MRLVRLKLRSEHFWNLPPIKLNESNDTSPQINIDLLNEHQRNVINKSIWAREIYAIDTSGEYLSDLGHANIVDGSHISTEDIDDEEDMIPQIVCITSTDNNDDDDDGGEPDGEKEDAEEKRRLLTDEAKILLNRNGNTLKKTIMTMEKTDSNLALLHVCLSLEEQGKKRNGVLTILGQAISEY